MFYHVNVVWQFGFWRQIEVVGANVEQSYISLKLKPKVTLFKAFRSMAIFPCSSLRRAFWWSPGRDCNAMKYSSQIFRKESNSRVSAMEIMVFLMGFFPFCSAEIRHSEIRSDYHFRIRVHTQRPPGNLCEGFLVQGHQGEWYRPGVHGVLPERQRCLASRLARSGPWRNLLCTRE